MRRLAVTMWALGAVVCLTAPLLPDPDTSDHGAMVAFGSAMLIGTGVVAAAPREAWTFRVAVFAGALLISGVVAAARPFGATPFFYLWPVLYTAYFLTRRDLVALLAVIGVSYAAALQLTPPDMRMIFFVGSFASTVVVGGLVHLLKARADRLVAELHRAAATDALTGLLNRGAFEEALGRELSRGRRSGLTSSLVLFDLDHFKQINDRLGHAAGDRALRCFAGVLRDQGRGGDLIARVGGEEFGVLLPGADGAAARVYAERVVRAVVRATEGGEAPLTVSAGVAEAAAGRETPDSLLHAADDALYVAKAAGRRRVAVFAGDVGPALV